MVDIHFGVERLIQDLSALGYGVTRRTVEAQEFAVVHGFEIVSGRFEGRLIKLGLPAPPNFPQAVGSAVHVGADPQLLEIHDTVPGLRNVMASPLGPDWRYWSYNLNWNPSEGRSADRLIRQVHGIFDRV